MWIEGLGVTAGRKEPAASRWRLPVLTRLVAAPTGAGVWRVDSTVVATVTRACATVPPLRVYLSASGWQIVTLDHKHTANRSHVARCAAVRSVSGVSVWMCLLMCLCQPRVVNDHRGSAAWPVSFQSWFWCYSCKGSLIAGDMRNCTVPVAWRPVIH